MKIAASVLLAVAFSTALLLGADKPKKARLAPGDKVQVDFGGTTEGEVVEIGRNGWIKVKINKNGIEMTPTLPPDKITPIAKPEKGKGGDSKKSGGKFRTWADKSGKFKVKAKFVELKDGEVTLETDEDKTVTLALDKLSKEDQKVAKDLAKEAEDNPFKEKEENPFESGSKQKKSASSAKDGDAGEISEADWSQVETVAPGQADKLSIAPDEAPAANGDLASKPIILSSTVKSKTGAQLNFFESVDGLLLDRARGQALAVIHDAAPGKPVVNRIQRVDLVAGKAQEPVEFPSVMKPVDVSPSGKLIVARTDNMFSGRGDPGVSVWKFEGESLNQVSSWSPVEPGDFFKSQASLAKFVDDDHVLTLSFPTKLTMWQVSKAKAVYKMEIGNGGAAALSAGGKYLAASFNNGVYVFDALSGKTLGKLPGEPGMVSSLSFRPDGRQLAAVSGQRFLVWELEEGKLYRDVYLPQAIHSPTIDWVSKGYVLLGGERLVDLDRRIVLWQYQHEAGRGFARGYGELGGYFWFALTSADRKERGLFRAKLPHDDARKTADSLDPKQLLAVQPGASVALDVRIQGTPAEQQQVQQALAGQLQSLEMTVANGAKLVLQATTETGKSQDITYRKFGLGGNETAKITEQICKLKFIENGKVVWESVSVNGAPMMLHLKEGQTVQDALNQYQKPNLQFFSSVKLPQYVARPGDAIAYGASSLTPQGIQNVPIQAAAQPGAASGR
ncbi:MAG: hypothetical protein HY290_00705 [Planctomycetia bacterium]|nr:hypothetical protein [Planctomycetia bacterium]